MPKLRRSVRFALAFDALLNASMARAEGPAVRWDRINVQALLEVIAGATAEGLDPAAYGGSALRYAMDRDAPDLAEKAEKAALSLARDFYEGRQPLKRRPDWHLSREAVDYGSWLDAVTSSRTVRGSFAKLLPQNAQYVALRKALATCRVVRLDCNTIRTNLDRWRALPRQFGPRYLWVNVPAYRLDLIEDGQVVASHKVIVGKLGTKTPLFRATVTGVTANPWWNVPRSIVNESIGRLVRTNPREAARRGYVTGTDADGKLTVRQKPGPDNALGRLKLEMANPFGVYIHDTPSRDLFTRDARAFSHGCIRAEQPDVLARALLGNERARLLDNALMVGGTQTIELPAPLPVYVVYFTVEPDLSETEGVVRYRDVYHRD